MRKRELRLTVTHLDKPDPGPARNEEVKHATGDYIWCVDGDDRISADCVTLIASQIEVAQSEVLFINQEVFYSDSRAEPGKRPRAYETENSPVLRVA
jgi:glycosyltransferase involved in cell wall biosynthesis